MDFTKFLSQLFIVNCNKATNRKRTGAGAAELLGSISLVSGFLFLHHRILITREPKKGEPGIWSPESGILKKGSPVFQFNVRETVIPCEGYGYTYLEYRTA